MFGAVGLVLVFALWWLYFDFSADHPVKPGFRCFWGWNLIHLPIVSEITAIGPSIRNIIELEGEILPEEVRLLLTGSIALTLVSIGVLLQMLRVSDDFKSGYRIVSLLLYGIGVVAMVIGVFGRLITPVMILFRLLILC